jgi:hypothetical protein
MINKEKMEALKTNININEINYPRNYSVFELVSFYQNCINTIRELPLYIVNSLNDENNLQKAEKVYLKLLLLYNGFPRNDESLLSILTKNFVDSFQKMTNNLIKSKVKLNDLLPSKFLIEKNEINEKEYIKIPSKNIIEIINYTWNININEKNNNLTSANKKAEDIMTDFSITGDTLDKSLEDLERIKLKYDKNKEEMEYEFNSQKDEKNNNLNQSKINIKFNKKNNDDLEMNSHKKTVQKEYTLYIDDDDLDKKENDEKIQENKENIQRQNNSKSNETKKMQLNTNIQAKDYKEVNLSKFNFNPLILIKLVIERMKEIDKIADIKNKPSLELLYNFKIHEIPENVFNDSKEFTVK